MNQASILQNNLRDSIALKQALLADTAMQERVVQLSQTITACCKAGGKVLFCGNGGSAADAQHLAAEFSGRYYYDRPPIYAEALHVNTSYLTAVANDYSFEEIYARMVKAMGKKGDVLIGLSTSGNSPNVVKALQQARELGMVTVGFTGQGGGHMKNLCEYLFEIPSGNTPRIQECHMLIGHSICELVEMEMFPK